MKKNFIIFLLLLSACWMGCKNPCKGKDCGNGVCDDGVCQCTNGWFKDANGVCLIKDLCYQKDCGQHGTCNAQTGGCDCEAGWVTSPSGKCDQVDLCYQKDCGNGSCSSSTTGECVCDDYYMKDANGICTIEARSKLVGSWRGNDVNTVSGTVSGFYTIVIEPVSFEVSKVKITNFFGFGCNGGQMQVYAFINKDGTTGHVTSSLCSQYGVDSQPYITFIDPTHIKIKGFIENAGTNLGWNLEGIYEKQ